MDDLDRFKRAQEPHADYANLAQQADVILRTAAEQGFSECAITHRQL